MYGPSIRIPIWVSKRYGSGTLDLHTEEEKEKQQPNRDWKGTKTTNATVYLDAILQTCEVKIVLWIRIGFNADPDPDPAF
jgi:hypothetical protein